MYMSSSYSSLDWVLSHWAHFTVYVFVFCVFFMLNICYIVLTWQGGSDGIEACLIIRTISSFSALTLLVVSLDL